MKGQARVSATGAQAPPASIAAELFNFLVPGTAKTAAQGSVSFADMFSAKLNQPVSEQNRQVGMEKSDESFKPLPKREESVKQSDPVYETTGGKKEQEKNQEPTQVSQQTESKSAMEAAASTQSAVVNQEGARKADQPVKNSESNSGGNEKSAQAVAAALKKLDTRGVNSSSVQMMTLILQNQAAPKAKTSDVKETPANEAKETAGQKTGESKKKSQQAQTPFVEVMEGQKSENAVKQNSSSRTGAQSFRTAISAEGEKPQQTSLADKAVLQQSGHIKNTAVKEKPEEQVKVQGTLSTTSVKPAVELVQPGGAGGLKPILTTPMEQVIGSARLAETRDLSPTNQIIRNVEVLIKNGQTSMQMQLYPENMGRIDLKLSQTPNGMVVMIIPDQGNTTQLLESQLDDLRKAFENAGIQLSNLAVGQHNPQAQDQGQDRSKNSPSYQAFTDEEKLSDIEETRTYQINLSMSMLDYRI